MRSLLNTEINRAERGEGGWHEKSKTGSLYKVQSRGPNWDMSSMGVKRAEKRRQRALNSAPISPRFSASGKFGGEPGLSSAPVTHARQICTFDHISTNTRPPGIERALFQQCLENLHLASPRLPSPATNISPPSSQRSHFTSTTPQPTPTISNISAFNPPHKTLSIRQNGTTGAANLALLQLNSAKEPVKTVEP